MKKTTSYITILLAGAILMHDASAQNNVGINSTGATPNASAMLDVSSTTQGMLMPRMTDAQRQAIKDPATGLLVYNTTSNKFSFYTGSAWEQMPAFSVSTLSGSASGTGNGVAINTNGSLADASAALDVSSTNKGMLVPRLDPSSISTPVAGLIVYNTLSNQFNYYNGSSWQQPCTEWVDNNKGTGAVTKGVAINGTAAQPDPSAILDVSSNSKGLLVPCMSSAQRNLINNPAEGLIIYDNTNNWLEYWSGAWYELTTAWTQLSPTGGPPAIRDGQIAVWNATNTVMYMFGGVNSSGSVEFNDLWAYTPNNNTWTQLIADGLASSPHRRLWMAAVWNPNLNVMYMFGGDFFGCNDYNDLWEYNPTTNSWTQLSPTGTPPAIRMGHSAVWDQADNAMLVFGGTHCGTSTCYNDVWEYNPTTNAWTTRNPTGTPPVARSQQGAVWNNTNGVMYVFGGIDNTNTDHNDVWQYSFSGNNWTQLTPTGGSPTPRYFHSYAWNNADNVMYIFGGCNVGGTIYNDLWQFSPSGTAGTWTQLNCGTPPAARESFTAVWNTNGTTMYLFGGWNSTSGYFNDLWEY